jgi:hypothetical protein
MSERPGDEGVADLQRPWSLRLAWAILGVAAPLFGASAFLAFEAARGAAHGFAFELALAVLFGCILPLIVVAVARRRGMWPGSATTLFCLAAGAIAALFGVLAGLIHWLR